jgi:signal transduction histidine kinase
VRLAVAGTGLVGAGLAAASEPAGAAAPAPVAWPLALAVALIVAAALAAAVSLRARRRAERDLLDTRLGAHALQQLVAGCRWRTDATHRLIELEPGRDVAPPAFDQPWRGRPPWELLHQPRLRQALEAQGAVDGLRVEAGAAGEAWTLDAVPRLGADGRFDGHVGTLRPLAPALAARFEHDALEALWHAWPGPAWLLAAAPPSSATPTPPHSLGARCNDAARALLGGDVPAHWEALLAALPPDLRSAVQAQAAGAPPARCGRWLLQSLRLDAPAGEARMLLLAPAAGDDTAAADQQSFGIAVSHDLRAPIRVVEGFARILKEDHGRQLDRIGNDHVERILAAAARMNHMIDALLGLARLSSQPLALQPVDLSQLAGYVVDDLRRQWPTPPADVAIAPGLVVQGDPTLLRMVLENLLGNAWKYSARAPRREITLERVRHDGRDAFVVRDNGAGFDMRFADRLFGVFQRLHSASDFQGTGVGLASVRRIVARHGGQVWAEGEVGRGARFYFTLGD